MSVSGAIMMYYGFYVPSELCCDLHVIRLFYTGQHCHSKMRLGWAGAAETFHSSATMPKASLHPLATDFRIDWKTVECLTLTGLPPLIRITPWDTAVR